MRRNADADRALLVLVASGGGFLLVFPDVRRGPKALAKPVRDLQHYLAVFGQMSEGFEGKDLGAVPGAADKERQMDEVSKWSAGSMRGVGDHVEVAPPDVVVRGNIGGEVGEAGERGWGWVRGRLCSLPSLRSSSGRGAGISASGPGDSRILNLHDLAGWYVCEQARCRSGSTVRASPAWPRRPVGRVAVTPLASVPRVHTRRYT